MNATRYKKMIKRKEEQVYARKREERSSPPEKKIKKFPKSLDK